MTTIGGPEMSRRAARGGTLVVQPGTAPAYWQPVPANGHIEVALSPAIIAMDNPIGLGTQTIPPGGYVREHAHDRNEEVIYVLRGTGTAVVEGERHPMEAGTAVFVGKNRRHMFINDGQQDLAWLWLITPNGLEDFFRLIGRPRDPNEPVPAPFARPDDVLEIERQTVFAPPPADPRHP